MPFWRREVVQNVTVIADISQVDEAVARIETATRKMEAARAALIRATSEARIARADLESSIVKSRNLNRGKW